MSALTDAEKALITRTASTGVGVITIRRVLRDAGFRRGSNIIQAFMHESGIPRLRAPPHTSDHVNHHTCTFCEWRGPFDHYYAHWRLHHRTRAGATPIEVISAKGDRRHA